MGTDVHAFQYDTRSSTRTYGVHRETRTRKSRKCGLRAHLLCTRDNTCRPTAQSVTDGFRGAPNGSHARSPSAPSAPSARTQIQLAPSLHSSPGTRHSRTLLEHPAHSSHTRHGHTIVPTRMFRPEGLPPTRSLGNNAPSTTVRSLALSSPHPPARPHRPTTLLVRRASAPGVCAVCLRRARLTPRRAASCSSGSVRVLRA
jgi:hypothetical protein